MTAASVAEQWATMSEMSGPIAVPDAVFGEIEDRVLWLATAIVDYANRVRTNVSGLKVGGHQASSASMVTLMTSLWFEQLRSDDRVSVKPHASPVLHAINYLLGDLAENYLSALRAFGGLQSYPSRAKDPDTVDYSTGSVGLGATAPIWGAIAHRYVRGHFPAPDAGSATVTGRQYALIGDAELDEGACWEAIVDPTVGELGEIVWIVDVNRQSLDRVVPDIGIQRLQAMFASAGWQILTAKYGRCIEAAFERPGGDSLRRRIDEMANPEYQRLLRHNRAEVRGVLSGSGSDAPVIAQVLSEFDDDELHALVRNLGGHDPHTLRRTFAGIDDSRPTVIFAYTIKGNRLSMEAHPQNHSALLNAEQLELLANRLGADQSRPWARFTQGSPAAKLCQSVADRLERTPVATHAAVEVPTDFGRTPSGTGNTQAALGRTLVELVRAAPEVASRVVTVSPDVSSSTNLSGWINKVGVWSPTDRPDWFADDSETVLHWRERSTGRHIELGIAETNLVGLLGELGATWNRWGQPLLPIGVLYDPFVHRALEPWSFGIYAGGQSILVGTPSGVTLASEGGAHQSISTPSTGLEQPGCVAYEPAFTLDLEWILLSCLAGLGKPEGRSAYLRLSTRPVDQSLAAVPADGAARERRRSKVIAGAYHLRKQHHPAVTLCAMGAVLPQALNAAEQLGRLGFLTDVTCITSPGLLFDAVRAQRGNGSAPTWILDSILPAEQAAPMVTVLDGHPHTLAFLAGVQGVPATHLGVTSFGQSGDLDDIYRYHGLDVDSIVAAALDLVD